MNGLVKIYTDGSSGGGQGGWAFFVSCGSHTAVRYGHMPQGTNNAAELQAIRHALLFVRPAKGRKIIVYSDSIYAINALTCFFKGWRRYGWFTATGTPVKNRQTIEDILGIIKAHNQNRTHVQFQHVRGHNGNAFNELADKHAVDARKSGTTNWDNLSDAKFVFCDIERTYKPLANNKTDASSVCAKVLFFGGALSFITSCGLCVAPYKAGAGARHYGLSYRGHHIGAVVSGSGHGRSRRVCLELPAACGAAGEGTRAMGAFGFQHTGFVEESDT